MEIVFLGTGASEGIPAPFCRCSICTEARRRGGKDLRTRTSVLIDKRYKIDLSPDTYAHSLRDPAALLDVEYLLVTHIHEDHFYIPELLKCRPPFAHRGGRPPLRIYGSRDVPNALAGRPGIEDAEIEVHEIKAFDAFQIGDARVRALPAQHAPNLECLLYLIEIGGRTYFHAHDTGLLLDEVYDALQGVTIDAMAFDCTHGLRESTRGHGSLSKFAEIAERLRSMGCATEKTHFVGTHFAHNDDGLYEELSQEASKHGITIGYDGMRIVI